jgi:hypothetical protein
MKVTIDPETPPGLQRISLEDTVGRLAKNAGAVYPTIGESSNGDAVIVDTDSRRVWVIELRELKVRGEN